MASELPDIPPNMRRLYRRFELWLGARTGRFPIPERLWAAAAELAREHRISPTASALRLDYGRLKQRVESVVPAAKGRVAKAPPPVPEWYEDNTLEDLKIERPAQHIFPAADQGPRAGYPRG